MSSAIADPASLYTIEEYVRMPDDGRKTELVRGKVVEVPPTYPYHGRVCFKVAKAVDSFVEAGNLGRMFANDSGVVTERDPDTLRGADVCYYSFTRLPAGPMPKNAYLDVMPELVFEVRSPSDRRPGGAVFCSPGREPWELRKREVNPADSSSAFERPVVPVPWTLEPDRTPFSRDPCAAFFVWR